MTAERANEAGANESSRASRERESERTKEYRADDWNALLDLLYRDAWDEATGRHRSPYVFRGLSNRDYRLDTSLTRFVGDSDRWDLELHLLRDFYKYAQREIREPKSVWHLLAVVQHHGLPTRLVDWTRSPLVAAYFATAGSPEVDGVVWMVDYRGAHDLLPEGIQAIRRREAPDVFDIDALAEVEFEIEHEAGLDAAPTAGAGDGRGSGVLHLLAIKDALAAFDSHHSEPCVIFFEPPAIDERIVNQSSVFSVLSDPTLPMDEWLERHPRLYREVIVPGELKAEFRDKLDQANINQRVLFPGLDGLAGWLRDYYTQGNVDAAG